MMFTPCWPSAGPTGGAGVAAPAWICSLMRAATFFLGGIPWLPCSGWWWNEGLYGGLDLGDVAEGELDRGFAAEDRHEHLELLGVDVDLGDRRGQGLERPGHDGDGLADLEVDDLALGGLRLVLGLQRRGEHREHLVEAQRHRLVGVPDEAGHAGRVP